MCGSGRLSRAARPSADADQEAFRREDAALPALTDRVRLLNRCQRWVVEQIDGLLARDLDDDTRAFLVEMRAVHLLNIPRCDELLVELDRQREVQVDRGYDKGESLEGGTT